jgi:hypothetical protein
MVVVVVVRVVTGGIITRGTVQWHEPGDVMVINMHDRVARAT